MQPYLWRALRLSRWSALVVLSATLPLAAQQAPSADPPLDPSLCRSMGSAGVLAVVTFVMVGCLLFFIQLDRRLGREGWSLARALSEPTAKLLASAPMSDVLLTTKPSKTSRSTGGSGSTAMPLLEPSSSRLIALLGMIVILLLYLGFGIFSLYSFGMTCQMPAAAASVTGFLYAGLTFFAPYIANKFSTLFQPFRSRSNPAEATATTVTTQASRPLSASGTDPVATAHHPAALAPPPVVRRTSGLPTSGHSTPAARRPQDPTRSSTTQDNPYAAAVSMVASFEGFREEAYPDPASGDEPWSIGYGFTTVDGHPVVRGDTMTRAHADVLLRQGVESCAQHLSGTIPYWSQMNDNQRCALIDFAWNLGEDFYGDESDFASISRDLREHNWAAVPHTLLLYCDPGTDVTAGLLRRRQAEGALWQKPVAVQPSPSSVPSSPQAADEESHPKPSTADQDHHHPNPLKVPYFDQLKMDDGQGWRDCFSASSAMLAAFWGKEPNEDDYNALRERYGDTTSSEAQLAALRHLGLTAEFHTDGTVAMLKAQIDAGRPVGVGWLCDGPVSAPSGGGHWSVVIGYDAKGFFINDPYGNCDLVSGGYLSHHDGAGLHYSYRNWVPRWRPEGSGGWFLTCEGQPRTAQAPSGQLHGH